MHFKVGTAAEKVEAERLVNVVRFFAPASAAQAVRAAPMDFPRKHASPQPSLDASSDPTIVEGYWQKHTESKFAGTLLSI
jgi:hypothetical protein